MFFGFLITEKYLLLKIKYTYDAKYIYLKTMCSNSLHEAINNDDSWPHCLIIHSVNR